MCVTIAIQYNQGQQLEMFQLDKNDGSPVTRNEFENFTCDVREALRNNGFGLSTRRDVRDHLTITWVSPEQLSDVSLVVKGVWAKRQLADRQPFAERNVTVPKSA